jgi:hypothetical protein
VQREVARNKGATRRGFEPGFVGDDLGVEILWRTGILPGPLAPLADQRGDGQHGLAFNATEMAG